MLLNFSVLRYGVELEVVRDLLGHSDFRSTLIYARVKREKLQEELKKYSPFWKEKILRNIKRDKDVNASLRKEGWTVMRFWGCEHICEHTVSTYFVSTSCESSLLRVSKSTSYGCMRVCVNH